VPGASEGPALAEGASAFAGTEQGPGDGGAATGPRAAVRGRSATVLGSAGGHQSRSATGVLANRMAAALVHHEPGWRLPRHTALARRFNVSTAEIEAAVEDLAERHLVRRLPDGQFYRSSPAEYLIQLEGVPGLASHVDPLGGELSCRSRQVSWRRVPEDIGWALGIPPGEPVCVVRLLWTAGGEPAAFSTTYLPGKADGTFATAEGDGAAAELNLLPLAGQQGQQESGQAEISPPGRPGAVHVEMQPPPPSVARSLRLSAGQPAAMVTVRFDDPEARRPVALTVAVLRSDLFRIVIDSRALPLPDAGEGSFSGAWTHAVEDWEP
jgi:DNA-binding GntR family transcriptional regulator